ncbi:MAG TPA: site-specific integrase [Acidobacteriaceae bacterium]|nr:site-specific integrase [Acidobacteriaceae bacterium]
MGRKSDALALYQKRKNEIRVGTKLPENMRRASIRFGQLAEDIRRYSEKHHRDQGHIESRLKRILPDFETRQADQIKPEEIDGWIARNTKAAATANRYRALFSLIFREALRNGKVTGNPARLVRLRHENNGRIRFLTDDEEKRLRKAITKQFPEHLPELTVSLGTGMRLSEQYSLTWEQIDFARKEINLEQTKNGSARTIPMNSDVLQAFEILHEMDAPASPSSRIFLLHSPRYWFATALAEARIARYRWHDNRHTFCSRLAMRGENMKVIQQLAGHKTIQMSARYAHLGEKNLRTAIEGLSTGARLHVAARKRTIPE